MNIVGNRRQWRKPRQIIPQARERGEIAMQTSQFVAVLKGSPAGAVGGLGDASRAGRRPVHPSKPPRGVRGRSPGRSLPGRKDSFLAAGKGAGRESR
jgi:hypothetical protein